MVLIKKENKHRLSDMGMEFYFDSIFKKQDASNPTEITQADSDHPLCILEN